MKIEDLVKQRNAALLSMDRAQIEAYMNANGVKIPEKDLVFWASVHKARTALRTLSMAERAASKRWLHVRGYQAMDDGDVLPPLDDQRQWERYLCLLKEWEIAVS